MSIEQSLREFVAWWRSNIKGDEKGEAQIFLDHLLRAFGHAGAIEAGRYEERIRRRRNGKTTVSFADYLIPKRVLIEMKKRGEDLKKHYTQLEEYWKSLDSNTRPRYAILCNFDEFWIFDFHDQYYDPVDTLPIEELTGMRRAALEFLVPDSTRDPVFQDNRVQVTKEAAFLLTELYHSLADELGAGIAQRFTLQCMVALFAEDVGLLPEETVPNILHDSKYGSGKSDNAHDLMALLFIMMNYPRHKRRSGRFHNVDYFDGGIFQEIHPLSLSANQMNWLERAASEDWSKIRPSIFGNIFEYSLDKRERHREGAHYTTERDIKRIVDPVIAEPWRNVIESVNTLPDAIKLYDALCNYVVLDPACGSGNFLYVAYREMKALESDLRERIAEQGGDLSQLKRRVTAKQFHGYDINEFAVELAKVSLMIAKKLAVDEFETDENPLPLDNLDDNIKADDALFNEWVDFDACIGNPPYMGANEIRKDKGSAYVDRVREAFPDVPGRADYCVYWFRKVHDSMQNVSRAGLVGTNTIRQNYSRIGGLDYVVDNGGVIYDAVSSMPWSGEANVHVSIVNWAKGHVPLPTRTLRFFEHVDDDKNYSFRIVEQDRINSSLSEKVDVRTALTLKCNIKPKRAFQGVIPGEEGFVVSRGDAENLIEKDRENRTILQPYMIGDDLLGEPSGQPTRHIIDFNELDIIGIRQYPDLYKIIADEVLPERKRKADEEQRDNVEAAASSPNYSPKLGKKKLLDNWWKYTARRIAMTKRLAQIPRFVACSRVTKRSIFDFVCSSIQPDSSMQVFAFDDDYSFGILQSKLHWIWFMEKMSTLREDPRYTPTFVYNTFPFPQEPSNDLVAEVANVGRHLHEFRRIHMDLNDKLTLRDMYRSMEDPGQNDLRDLHDALDQAVLAAYGFDPDADLLEQLLALNLEVAAKIEAGESVTAPGIPPDYPNPTELISDGCIQPPDLI